jgi:hypothetical protein
MKIALANLALGFATVTLTMGDCSASPKDSTAFIKVDQFGYRNADEKIAVMSNPQKGYNAADSFTPGKLYQVRDWETDAVVLSGKPVVWKNGAVHDQSGDKVWWFDFSALTTPGSYYVFDVTRNKGSGRFEINNTVYRDVMKAAMRMFYYQRDGFNKKAPFAVDADYSDTPAHIRANQDVHCHYYDRSVAMPEKDLSGGWFDAGDYNKYVNHLWEPVLDLLLAYEQNPTVWADNYGIPESDNGVPDVLDEVKVGLEWLRKMQNADGSVLSVVGTNHHETATPPSADAHDRFYGPATTQATFATAGMFALASIQFNAFDSAYASKLKEAAVRAWDWADAHPNVIFHNNNESTGETNADGKINYLAEGDQESGGPAWFTARKKFAAAVYLYAATGDAQYKTRIENATLEGGANNDIYYEHHFFSGIAAESAHVPEADAALYYTKTAGASAEVSDNILQWYKESIQTGENNYLKVVNKTDAYRAYISHYNWDSNKWESIHDWGSNAAKARQATLFLNMQQYGLDAANVNRYNNAASGFVHYFHGVNPNYKTYLTNMGQYGAESSVMTIYHSWFGEAVPPPGYVPGGPNQNYNKSSDCYPQPKQDFNPPAGCSDPVIEAVKGQPAQKSWRDFGKPYPVDSWTVTEPQILMQATYVRMLSKFL